MKFINDSQVSTILAREKKRQEQTINLIASEAYIPPSALSFLGSVFTNKYGEGYPHKRYYPGCAQYDSLEELCYKRALDLFHLSPNAWSVNVQAYSGSVANLALYHAFMKPGDTLLALDLSAGGHLSHGSKANISSHIYKVVSYGVTKSYRIDYKQLASLALQHKPKVIVSGASAYPFAIDFKKIGAIAKKVGAIHIADISHYAGLVSAGAYPSPFPHADAVMTTTHKSLFSGRGALIFVKKKYEALLNKAVFPGMQGGPHYNAMASIAYGLLFAKRSAHYYKNVVRNAHALVETFLSHGIPCVGGGTESHMFLLRVADIGLTGGEVETLLECVGITANRNMIFGDESPSRASAVRIGTYAVTMRGMNTRDMKRLGDLIVSILRKTKSEKDLRADVATFCKKFPIPH